MNYRRIVPPLGFLFGDGAESGREDVVVSTWRSPSTQAIARIVRATKSRFRFGKIFRAGNDLVHNATKGNDLLRRLLRFFCDVDVGGDEDGVASTWRSPSTQAIAPIVRATKGLFRIGNIFRAWNDLIHNAIKGNELLRRRLRFFEGHSYSPFSGECLTWAASWKQIAHT